MDSYSVRYKFSQEFDFPAKDAFDWSLDYREDDMTRMGKKGLRKIKRINDDTIILSDIYPDGDKKITKLRLIKIYPELLTMINTRISDANKHSQFIYKFVPIGKSRSRLEFTGSHVFYGKNPGPAKIRSLAKEMASEDSQIWVHLAQAMKEDLSSLKI